MDGASVALKLRTVKGEKLKLLMMRGDGPLGGLGGGETQRQGVQALGEWFARHQSSRAAGPDTTRLDVYTVGFATSRVWRDRVDIEAA